MADAETLAVLKSIDLSLRTLVVIAQEKPPNPHAGPSAPAPRQTVASDTDLDGHYGNPIVKAKHPHDWTGEPMNGKRFSECPAEYLELVADRLDYFAGQSEATGELASNGKPVAGYKRLDAARARGWAKRVREGKTARAKAAAPAGWTEPADDEAVPF
jgi:hypothetical protein